MLGAIARIVRPEAAASGAPRPRVPSSIGFPAVVNDLAPVRAPGGFEVLVGADRVVDPGLVTGSEDVGLLASASGAPCVFWLLGGAEPAASRRDKRRDMAAVVAEQPSNHSPYFAPMIDPTLRIGAAALVHAAHTRPPVGR